ncbi:hypothetical protein [Janthinobacterium sp. UMAB-56]|uniref:hypothetical protein n=1 Tax=Janthinobacterium sp. UMAB-56 TaxID=1365361 RepID=UPI001C57051E|nr:hypothetical protein [Janthinobacterium sp. UMAB-56]
MKERPILMNAAMVRAVLDGSKTQTRRVVKFKTHSSGAYYQPIPVVKVDEVSYEMSCPHGNPGDRLWVRETFGYVSPDEHQRPHSECKIEYRADLELGCTDRPGNWPVEECVGDPERPRWRPSIHMPRAASRILLEIVSVNFEQLQDISEDDCWAEGIDAVDGLLDDMTIFEMAKRMDRCFEDAAPTFGALWESINGAGSWAVNPLVWVIEFKRVAP